VTVPYFQWKVLMLDDEPSGIRDTLQILSEKGFVVTATGASPSDLGEHSSNFDGVNFAFCDMKWDNFGSGAAEIEITYLPPPRMVPKATYIQQWVTAVQFWSGPNTPTAEGGDQWPKSKISLDDIGVWLAALVANLNPDVKIILYSRTLEIQSGGPLAALGRFPHAQFEVLPKTLNQPLSLNEFWPHLADLQRHWLSERRELRQWLMADVIIPQLIGHPLVEREFQALRGSGRAKYAAKYFFPNAVAEGNVDVLALSGLLPARTGLSAWEEASLEHIKHALRRWLDSPDGLDKVEVSQALIERCYESGEVGIPIARALEAGRMLDGEAHDALTRALSICEATLAGREKDLIALCSEYGGETTYEPTVTVFRPGSESNHDKINPRLPFDYHVLRSAIHHLDVNSQSYGGSEHRFVAVISDRQLQLTWTDNSRGFDSWEDFIAKLAESARKRRGYRGIPFAILFGLRYKASLISVLLNNGEWHNLWSVDGAPTDAPTKDSAGTAKFGMTWVFGTAK
jgi:hypothetical protein